ncbi:NAD(P)-dependent oxidoreductase [uncultured Hoeflea sp.]|uniref:NAD(P)-dependent oxidoreductase n=1 Tax=uncultured Hoeflea sp. TaxID=538666 RepID=UPI00260BA31B|nr:NAD(P)-dependent oxidoreductase [uncultured Hoeflea sp.]
MIKIAFLGIGLMGRHQAQHLIDAGFDVTAWNRTRAKAEALRGAAVADTPREAACGADIVVTMLENGPIVDSVLFDGADAAICGLREGALVLDMSSIKPVEAQAHATRLGERGIAHVDAPVSGGTVGAEQATLAIMCGGSETDFARAETVLSAMGRPVHVGPSGSGQIAKLANQMIVGTTIATVAEALALAARAGADPAKVREALTGGFADSRVLELHGQRMVSRDFVTRGRTATHVKDLDNAIDAARRLDFRAPVLEQVTSLFHSLAKHQGDPDHSALLLEIERLNSNPETSGRT